MVPESVATFLAFLGLVTPGLVYQLLRERSRPALEETGFREASRVALTSLVFTSLALATLAAVASKWPDRLPEVDTWLAQGTQYAAANLDRVAQGLGATVALSSAFAFVAHWVIQRARARHRRAIVKTSVWYQLFCEDVPKGKAAWVMVKLVDGSQFWGYVDFFTVGQAMEDRELSLRGPKLSTRPMVAPPSPRAETEHEPLTSAVKQETYWERVLVRATDIAVIKVTYEPARQEQSWLTRVASWLSLDPS